MKMVRSTLQTSRDGMADRARSLAARLPDTAWLVLAWAIASLPNLTVRSFIWEEGTNAELARNFLAGNGLLNPMIYGVHYVFKPTLLPWRRLSAGSMNGRRACRRCWRCSPPP